jgi:hypothetical protein
MRFFIRNDVFKILLCVPFKTFRCNMSMILEPKIPDQMFAHKRMLNLRLSSVCTIYMHIKILDM